MSVIKGTDNVFTFNAKIIIILLPKVTTRIQVKIWFQNRRNKWKRQLAADAGATGIKFQVNVKYTFKIPCGKES